MTCKLVADVAVVAGDHVLLIRYRDTSRYHGWALDVLSRVLAAPALE